MAFGYRVLCWGALLVAGLAAGARAAEPSPEKSGKNETEFLRLTLDENRSPVALEAAIVRLASRERGLAGPTVDLISAIHVAEPEYYAQLNRRFEEYDAVLYELVAPEGTRVPKGGPKGPANPVSALQNGITAMLNLQFQLEGIDYTRPNLVHADMSPDEFARSMRDRGESVAQIFLRMVGYALSRQGESASGPSEAALLVALFSEDRAMGLKRALAGQFSQMEGSLTAINGPDGSTLITERNKVALKVLGEEMSAGKRKLAIFFGAGHMPDFCERLANEFHLVPVGTEWLVAWNLKADAQ